MRYSPLSLVAIAAVVLEVASPSHALAQAQPPASIPVNLVSALFGEGGRISVGELPMGFPADLVPPPPATVVGGMITGRSRTAVFAYPGSPTAASASYRTLLDVAGFKGPPMPVDPRGGFVAAVEGSMPWVCRDSVRVMMTPTGGARTGSYLRVNITADPDGSGCRVGMPGAGRTEPEFQFPVLRAPPGVNSTGGSGSSGSGESSISTRLITSMSHGDMMAHYVPQLEAAGWKAGPPLVAEHFTLRPVTATDTKGRAWRGAIMIFDAGERRDVSVRMVRIGPE